MNTETQAGLSRTSIWIAGLGGYGVTVIHLLSSTVSEIPTEAGTPRWFVLVPVALAFGATTLLLRFIAGQVRQPVILRNQLVAEVGVILFFVLGVAACYAWAYTHLGLIYTAPADDLRTAGIDWTSIRSTFSRDFKDAFYYSVVTLTTVGYGDYRPAPAARGLATIEALHGLLLTGIVISFFFKRLE